MWQHLFELLTSLGIWIICVVAAERTTEVLTTAEVFAWLRSYIVKWHVGRLNRKIEAASVGGVEPLTRRFCADFISYFLSKIMTCSWCNSFWSAAFFSLFLPGSGEQPVQWYLPKAIALFGFANLWHAVFRRVHRGMVHTIDLKCEVMHSMTLITDLPTVDPDSLESNNLEEENGEDGESAGAQ